MTIAKCSLICVTLLFSWSLPNAWASTASLSAQQIPLGLLPDVATLHRFPHSAVRLGPGIQYVETVDYAIDDRNKRSFYESAKKLLPFIDYEDLEPEMVGIRPKLQEPGGGIKDFVIRDENDKGFPGFINLIGIESPGLTASPAIAGYVASLVEDIRGG